MSVLWMGLWMVWLLAALVLGLIWLVRFLLAGPALRRRIILDHGSHPEAGPECPRVSVIVAARNEVENIETCVVSLLQQDYPRLEIIAVDDRSTDGTLAILRRLEERHGEKLRVVCVESLHDGWFGKNNAMREGVAIATGDWFCFTDADCQFTSRRAITIAVREAQANRTDFLSLTPVLETETAWERVIQPVCGIVLIWWFLPERVNNPEKRTAYANGAFMLVRRACYAGIGGHEAVRTEVNEDIRMARRAKRQGFALRVVENEDLYRTRMYRTLREAWRGWSRIFYGCFQTPRRLVRVASLHLAYAIVPWLSLGIASVGRVAWASHDARPLWNAALAAWAVVVLFLQATMWRIYPVTRHSPAWSLAYFPGACVCWAMMLSSILKSLGAGSTTWRGRTYRANRVIPDAPSSARDPAEVPATPPVSINKSASHA